MWAASRVNYGHVLYRFSQPLDHELSHHKSTLPTMELPGALGLEDGLPMLLVLAIVALISVYVLTTLLTDPESAVDFDISEPEQLRSDWKGPVLENPSIKVHELSGTLKTYI